jgi:tetratricopeptide (TPR) repeat protein
LILNFAATANGDDLKKAWDAFAVNNRTEATNLFRQAAKDPATKAEASLALSLISRDNGDGDAAFRYFMDFYKASDNPYPYTFALWTTSCVNTNYNKKDKEQVEFLKMLAADPKANQCMKSLANSMLGYHYQKSNDFKSAKEYFGKIDIVQFNQAVGQFENVSGSGFNKDFGVLGNPTASAVFKNKVGADVKWLNVKYIRNDRWFDFAYNFNSDDAVCYAQSFVNSPADQDVILRAGASGSMKIWVNDKLVSSIFEERNTDLDVYSYKIKLGKGYNRILVQVGKSELNRANFMVRLFDMNENILPGITYATEAQSYSKASDYEVQELPFFADAFFMEKLKAEPKNLLYQIMLGEIQLRNDKAYEARKAFTAAAAIAPQCTYIKERLIECYSRDENTTMLTKAVESIKTNDPESYYAIREFYDDAMEKEDYDEAEKLLDKMVKTYGATLLTDALQLDINVKRKKFDDIVSVGKALYDKYPDNWEIVNLKYTIETSVNKDYDKANDILVKYLKTNNNETASNTLASNYFKKGAIQKGFDIYLKRTEDYPYATGYYENVADLYFSQQDYTTSEKWIKKILEMCPYNGYYWNQLGKIYEAMNKTEDAKMAFAKCIYYSPTNYEAHRLLRKMQEKKDLFDYFPEEDINKLYTESPKAKDFPEDNSMILLNEMQRIVYPEGATEQKTELMIKIFNQAGIDSWKEYAIGYNEYTQRLIIEKAEVIKSDGNKVKAETNGNQMVFTSLEIGDAIHVTYRIEDYVYGQLAAHFTDRFNLNYSLPVGLTKYSLIVPEDKKFNYKVINSDLQPAVSSPEAGYKLYAFQKSNLPGLKSEPYMPPLDDVGMVIDISSIPDWKTISNWYADLANTKAKSDYEIKEAVAEVFRDKPKDLTQLQKAKLIYEYIEKNVSYSNVSFLHGAFIPQKASRTLNTKLGDCKDVSTLFVAMCREVGVTANLVLVSTRDNGDQCLVQPNVGFNHCIAHLDADGKEYFIELTDNKLSFSTLGSSLMNTTILQIPTETKAVSGELERLKSNNRVVNNISRTADVSFNNNDLSVKRKTVRTGVFADGTRYDYAELGREEQMKTMSQAIGSDFSTPVKLTELNFGDLASLNDTVSYNLAFNVSNALMDVAGMKIIKLPWSESYSSLDFLTLEKRMYPFNLWSFSSIENAKETMSIEVPKGKLLVEMPKSVTINNDLLSYSLSFKMVGTKLMATRSLKFNKEIVSPADYNSFKETFTKISEADSRQIAFK